MEPFRFSVSFTRGKRREVRLPDIVEAAQARALLFPERIISVVVVMAIVPSPQTPCVEPVAGASSARNAGTM